MNGGEYVNVSILRKRKPHKIMKPSLEINTQRNFQ